MFLNADAEKRKESRSKKYYKMKKKLIVFALLLQAGWLFCQSINQPGILPLPSGQYLKFDHTNNWAKSIESLTRYDNFNNVTTGLLPTEEELENAFAYWDYDDLSYFHYYRGQAPKFCFNIQYDSIGEIVFFIVDNNIYNANGIAFYNISSLEYGDGSLDWSEWDFDSYVHNGPVINPLSSGYTPHWFTSEIKIFGNERVCAQPVYRNINRWGKGQNNGGWTFDTLYHNPILSSDLLVLPDNNTPNAYTLVYMIQNSNSLGALPIYPEVFYRRMVVNSQTEVSISEPHPLAWSDVLCNENNRCNIISSAYRPSLGMENYMVIVNFFDNLYFFESDNLENSDMETNVKRISINCDGPQQSFRSEMEIKRITQGQEDYYLLAVPFCSNETHLFSVLHRIYKLPVSFDLLPSYWTNNNTNASTYNYYSGYSSTLNSRPFSLPLDYICNSPKGLEFSPDGNTLYFTFGDVNNQCPSSADPTSMFYVTNILTEMEQIPTSPSNNSLTVVTKPVPNPGQLQFTEIESGRDGNLWFAYNNAGATGLATLTTPNDPIGSSLIFNPSSVLDLSELTPMILTNNCQENILFSDRSIFSFTRQIDDPVDCQVTNIKFDETWNTGKHLCNNLTIGNITNPEMTVTLTANDIIMYPGATSITIRHGGILNLNGIIHASDGNGFTGEIIVEEGGELYINSTGVVDLAGTSGRLLVEDGGLFTFQKGAQLILADNETVAEITGTLDIQSLAIFSFTGNGFVRFNSPYTTSNNITCGTNASISLTGSGQSDIVLEINQNAINCPSNLESIQISHALVRMAHSTAMLNIPGSGTDVSMVDVRFSPQGTLRTTHRGLRLSNQENCIISGCTFENGVFGIYNWMTSNKMRVENSNFFNNSSGIWIHGFFFELSGCSFQNNLNVTGFPTAIALYAEATSLNNNLIENTTFTNNTNHIQYINCDGNILIDNCTLNITPNTAITANGTHDMLLKCTKVTNVTGASKTGVYMLNGAALFMTNATTPASTRNYITGAYAIRLSNARTISLNGGANYICPNTVGTYKHIYGTISENGCGSTIQATQNQWYANLNPLSSSHYQIWHTPMTPSCSLINPLNTTPTAQYSACSGGDISKNCFSQIDNLYFISGVESMKNAQVSNNWSEPFSLFLKVFDESRPEIESDDLWNNSWENMRNCLKQMFLNKQISSSSDIEFIQAMEVNSQMVEKEYENKTREFQIELEKATLYRMIGEYDHAISILNKLIQNDDLNNKIQAEDWLCIVTIEKRISEGELTTDNAQKEIETCSGYQKLEEIEAATTDINLSNSVSEESSLRVFPNPANSSSVVSVNTANNESGIIEISDIFGRLVTKITVNAGYSENKLPSDISNGIYTLTLKQKGITIQTTRIIIEE